MKKESFTQHILTADAGKYLTNADPNTPDDKRVITPKIYLGKFDSPDNYIEIDSVAARSYAAARKAAIEAARIAKEEEKAKQLAESQAEQSAEELTDTE